MRDRLKRNLQKLLAGVLAAVLIFSSGDVASLLSVRADGQDQLEFSVLDASGYVLAADGSGQITPSDFRDNSGTVRVNVTLNKAITGNVLTVTLPSWFSWYGVQDTNDFTVSTSDGATSTGQGQDNVLTVTYNDLTNEDERTFSNDFNFRLNSSVMTGDVVTALEGGGLTNMTFSASLTNSADTEKADDITVGYDFKDMEDPSATNLTIGPIGNLLITPSVVSHISPVQQGIYNALNQNSNTLVRVSMPAADPFAYGAAVDSIVITLSDNVKDIYKINGFKTASDSSMITVFDNYTASVSADGNTLTLTPKSAGSSVDLDDVAKTRLLGAVDLGFRLADGSVYDRDTWKDKIGSGIFTSGASTELVNVNVNYKPFTTAETVGAADITKSVTSTATMCSFTKTAPSVKQTSAETTTYVLNQQQYGDDPITVAAVVKEAGSADETTWIGESINNLVTSSNDNVSIPQDASGYKLVTEYPYEVRGTEYQIRPRYMEAASSLADKFAPGGYELDKVVFTLSNGSTVEVSAENTVFAQAWNEALASNDVMTVTAEQLGVASSFDESNESSVVYVKGVTQFYKTAAPSI